MRPHKLLGLAFLVLTFASCGGRQPSDQRDGDRQKTAPPNNASESSGDKPKEAGADTIDLSPEVQKRIGILVAPAEEAPLAVPLQVTGSVQPIDNGLGHVRPLAHGRIVDVLARVGDRVMSGQILATFDNVEAGELASQYNTARAELARLRAQMATVTRQVERSRKLVDIGAVPQKEYESSIGEQQQLEESIRGQESTIAGMEARLRRFGVTNVTGGDQSSATSIRAPFAGVVIKVSAGPGEVVDSTAEVFTIADLSRVFVQAQVYEKDLGRVQKGQTANIHIDAYPQEQFTGRIVSIGDIIDPQTRTATVRSEVPNPKALLKLDMFATVDLPTAASARALVVPSDAVQTYEGKTVVFVRSGSSTFASRIVEPGRTVGNVTEILRGLKPGEPVVARGAFQVKSAAQAKELGEKEEKE